MALDGWRMKGMPFLYGPLSPIVPNFCSSRYLRKLQGVVVVVVAVVVVNTI